jgi:hypothetical protein
VPHKDFRLESASKEYRAKVLTGTH